MRKTVQPRLRSWFASCLLFVVSAAIAATADDVMKSTGPESISSRELAELIRLEQAPLILDVRSEEEFNETHIPGAVNIPHDQLRDRVSEINVVKTDEIVVHCIHPLALRLSGLLWHPSILCRQTD